MYKDFSFRYVIIITKHLCFAIIYVCVCVCVLLSNSKIKPKTQNILTKHKKLFFFNHSFNQTQETVFFFNYSFNQTPTFFKINLTKSTFLLNRFFSNHNHNAKHALNKLEFIDESCNPMLDHKHRNLTSLMSNPFLFLC
jgi:hypothetical protein